MSSCTQRWKREEKFSTFPSKLRRWFGKLGHFETSLFVLWAALARFFAYPFFFFITSQTQHRGTLASSKNERKEKNFLGQKEKENFFPLLWNNSMWFSCFVLELRQNIFGFSRHMKKGQNEWERKQHIEDISVKINNKILRM